MKKPRQVFKTCQGYEKLWKIELSPTAVKP